MLGVLPPPDPRLVVQLSRQPGGLKVTPASCRQDHARRRRGLRHDTAAFCLLGRKATPNTLVPQRSRLVRCSARSPWPAVQCLCARAPQGRRSGSWASLPAPRATLPPSVASLHTSCAQTGGAGSLPAPCGPGWQYRSYAQARLVPGVAGATAGMAPCESAALSGHVMQR
jgi:hypothetical protein